MVSHLQLRTDTEPTYESVIIAETGKIYIFIHMQSKVKSVLHIILAHNPKIKKHPFNYNND